MFGAIRGVRCVFGGLAGSVATQGQKGYRWHKGHWGLLGVLGAIRVCIWGLVGNVDTQGPEEV